MCWCGLAASHFSAAAAILINEIHYNPDVKTEPAEFVELFNTGPGTVNLTGWYFSEGLNYVFPATNVAAGGFVVVAQNPAFLQTKYGAAGALGPFNTNGSSGLAGRGDKITLRNAANQIQDEVEYALGFPWPTVGDPPGYSIELIHPSLDNDLGGSWRASTSAAVGQSSNTLVADGASWKFFKGTNEASSPTTAWRMAGFNDTNWDSGAAPIGYGEAFIVTPLNDMRSNYTAVFFRKTFTVSDPFIYNTLSFEAQYDDGFKVWINGSNVLNQNISVSEVPFDGTAGVNEEFATFRLFTLNNPSAYLQAGTNVIAIQAHNISKNDSSDFFLNVRLAGLTGAVGAGPTPGRINAVYSLNAPPQIRQVEHAPKQPAGGVPVRITAKVTDPDGVSAVTLEYQIVNPGSYIELASAAYTNAANWISVPMNDVGTNSDVTAGDDLFMAEIPAAVQTHRRLIRYRITVADTGGRSVRVPYVDDPEPNFAYFVYNGVPAWTGAVQPGAGGSNGAVVTVASNEMSRLPTIHLIGVSNTVATATWFSRYGGDLYQWGGTLVYDGKVYDHVRYRARGGVWRYSMVKNMWKFDFNRGHDFEARDNWGRKFDVPWRKLNLGSCIQQGDFNHRGEQGLFESVGFRLFQMAGVEGPNSTFSTLRVIDDAQEAAPGTQYEGDFWGLYLMLEQEDGRFLEEHERADSNFYKMEGGTGELNNLGPNGPSDKSDLNYILNNYTGATDQWWRTNWNLGRYYSYQAIVQGIHHFDISDNKNYFYYYDSQTRLWEVVSWDLDLTWAHNMYRSDVAGSGVDRLAERILNPTKEAGTGGQAGTGVMRLSGTRPVFDTEFRNRVREIRDLLFNTDQAWKLIEEYAALARGPVGTPSVIDADRMQWDYNPKMNDGAYTPNLGKAGTGRYYQFPSESGTNVALKGSFNASIQVVKNYVNTRAGYLDELATDAAKPATPTVASTGPGGFPINRLNFRSTNYSGGNPFAALRWRVGEITDTNSINYRADEPRKYEIETVWESGPIAAFNADITVPANLLRVGSRYRLRVQHTDTTARNSHWSAPQEFVVGPSDNLADLLNYLRITEVMYNPLPGGFEFIELHNTSATLTLDLAGVKFTQGIDFTFPSGATLAPGAYLVVVGTADLAAFRAYHGLAPEVVVYGPYSGSLNNAGEQLVLRTSAGGSDIVNFSYGDGRGWPVAADGGGHSMVFLDGALAAQGSGAGDYAGSWRGSTFLRGSPGAADAVPVPTILLNEIVAHTDFTNELDSNDWIELFNPTDSPVTLGPGWYLSDDGSAYTNLMKWAIPTNTTIPAHGWVSFDEVTGFHFPTNIGFGLNKGGEQVFLSYLPGTVQDRVVDAVSFKGQENDWSLGRYPDGAPFWYGLTPRTRDTTNAAPPSRVHISEVNYHPPDFLVGTNLTDNSLDEFVEIHNGTPGPVTLHNTNGTWRVNGGVNFTFPTNLTLAADEYALLVNFDPSTNAAVSNAFRSLYGITDPALRILGPYAGKLANNSDRLALELPQHPDGTNDSVSWVIVDEVLYADQPPWPCGSDGTGNSLQRLSTTLHGTDPAQWAAEPPTAGRARANLPAGLPTITSQPQDRIAATNGSTSFSVSLCGTPPFAYQWLFNEGAIGGATNATLNLSALTVAHAGGYRVIVANAAGSITSQVATLIVQSPPFVLVQPQPVVISSNQSAFFSVTAGGTPPLAYQWQRNTVNLPGATNDTLLLTNVHPSQAGQYRVLVSNTAGSVFSSNVLLTVQVPVYFSIQPTNQITVEPGTNVNLVSLAVGNGTVLYQWRFEGTNLPHATNATFSFANASLAFGHGIFSVVATDDLSTATSSNALVFVRLRPGIVLQPLPQAVIQGQSAMFICVVTGAPPISIRWLTNGVGYLTNSSGILVIPNAQLNFSLRANPVNLAGGVNSSTVALTILRDFDGDGLADSWETNYFGFSTNNPADGLLDFDGDGMSNYDEYRARTNPTNALSVLKLVPTATNASVLQFIAQTNLTYTVLGRTNLTGATWTGLTNVLPSATVRTVLVDTATAPVLQPERYYRVTTPFTP